MKAICINNGPINHCSSAVGELSLKKWYDVEYAGRSGIMAGYFILANDQGRFMNYLIDRFITVQEFRTTQLHELLHTEPTDIKEPIIKQSNFLNI
jgi:hypothetical protein